MSVPKWMVDIKKLRPTTYSHADNNKPQPLDFTPVTAFVLSDTLADDITEFLYEHTPLSLPECQRLAPKLEKIIKYG